MYLSVMSYYGFFLLNVMLWVSSLNTTLYYSHWQEKWETPQDCWLNTLKVGFFFSSITSLRVLLGSHSYHHFLNLAFLLFYIVNSYLSHSFFFSSPATWAFIIYKHMLLMSFLFLVHLWLLKSTLNSFMCCFGLYGISAFLERLYQSLWEHCLFKFE